MLPPQGAGAGQRPDATSIHKGDEVKAVFKEKGFIKLYVPPYSPWFNPIEGCFSIVKRQYPVKQNIKDSFASLTQMHFSAFFKKSLSTYGVDEEDALANTANDVESPTNSAHRNQRISNRRKAAIANKYEATCVSNSECRERSEGHLSLSPPPPARGGVNIASEQEYLPPVQTANATIEIKENVANVKTIFMEKSKP
jgi:hypothetical protein